MLTARIERQDPAEKRAGTRSGIGMRSTARDADNTAFDVEITDFSPSGLAFISESAWPIDSRIVIGLVGAGRVGGTIVRREGNLHGCAFDRPLTANELANAFSGDQPAALDLGHRSTSPQHEIADDGDVEKLPPLARVGIIVLAAGLPWAAILAIYFA